MRLFVAIDIEEPIRERIARFIEGVRGFAPEPRWVKPGSLHVTLKFIGETSDYERICEALGEVRGEPVNLRFKNTGFFPTPRSARVFWIGIEAGPELAQLASAIDRALQPLGIEPEKRAYTPHLTLARSGSGAPRKLKSDCKNNLFARLQENLAALPPPEFGTMTAREFYLFESKLKPGGAEYSKRERFPLS